LRFAKKINVRKPGSQLIFTHLPAFAPNSTEQCLIETLLFGNRNFIKKFRLAYWSVAFACLFPPNRSHFKSNLYQTLYTDRHQSGEEL